jgi:hypothetical protein
MCDLMARRPLQEVSHHPSPNHLNLTGQQEIPDNKETHTSNKLHVTLITIYQYYKYKATYDPQIVNNLY